MFFDRYEIHIQVFANVFMEHLSFSDPHLHENIFQICTHMFTNKNRKTKRNTWYLGHTFFENVRFLLSPRLR